MASVLLEILAILAGTVAFVAAYLWYLAPGPRDHLD